MVKIGEKGQWTGLRDRHGTPVYVGDVLQFDPEEWGSDDAVFEVKWDTENCELDILGVPADIPLWCTVVRHYSEEG
jgi:hypothetical protein